MLIGHTLILVMETVEAQGTGDSKSVSHATGIPVDSMRCYLRRLTRYELLIRTERERIKGAPNPCFQVVPGWRNLIRTQKKRGRFDPIQPLPMSVGVRTMPKVIINSVFALGQL